MTKVGKAILFVVSLLSCIPLWPGTGPSHGIDPEIDKIEKVIANATEIKREYVLAQKAKKYKFEELAFNFAEDFDPENSTVDNNEDTFRKNEEYLRNEKVQKAIAAVEGLGQNKLIQNLSKSDLVKLPLGIVKTFGSTTYSIVFDQAKIFTTYAEVRVYGRIKNDKVDLCFGAEDIKVSFEGGIIGDATLALFGDFAVPLKSEKIAVVFNQFQESANNEKSGSYITFDCDGFLEAGLDVDIVLSRDWVLPTDASGRIQGGDKRVVGNAVAKVRDFDDFVAEATMPYFTLTQDTSVSILLSRATFDYSEVNNAVGFQHPSVYDFESGEFLALPPPDEIPLWRGFYIEKIEIVLPHVFKSSDNQALIVGADKVYIDERGVSAYVYGDGLIPIETGTIGESKWAFALDHVGVQINYNRILNFDFDGRIHIPINDETQKLNYTAYGMPSQNHYNIEVGLDSTMSFPVFKAAEVRLNAGSKVFVDVKEDKFVPGAVLCGGMYIAIGADQGDSSKVELNMGGVEFHKIMIRDTLPYVTLDKNGGSITLLIPPILNNSPITIDHLSLTNRSETTAKLGFGVEVNVQSSDAGGGKTGGAFGILGEYKEVNGKEKWTFAGVEVDAMNVEIVMGTYLWISGGLEFFRGDEVWGDGFYGYLSGGIVSQDGKENPDIGESSSFKLTMQASARFGTKNPDQENEYKYWAYDFYIASDKKLFDIYPPIHCKGFGGGVYHHMKMASYNVAEMAEGAGDNPYSGISYEPNDTTLFGIKLSLGIGIEAVDGFKGNVTLELAIDTDYTLQNIMLYGNGEFVNDLFQVDATKRLGKLGMAMDVAVADADDEAKVNVESRITAAMMIYMDFENGFELQGNFGAYLDAAGGVIKGQANIDLFLSTTDQHFYIGGYEGLVDMNDQPLPESFVSLSIGGFSVIAKFYLCTGNKLPPPPPIPYAIASAFNKSTTENNRGSIPSGGENLAAGFAMGASIAINMSLNTTFVRFLFDLLAGFDLSLLSNPSQSYCSAQGSGEHGVRGWRARGNIYGSMVVRLETINWLGTWKTRYSQDVKVWLSGDVPRPSYFFIKYQYKNWAGVTKRKETEYGNKCGQVVGI